MESRSTSVVIGNDARNLPRDREGASLRGLGA